MEFQEDYEELSIFILIYLLNYFQSMVSEFFSNFSTWTR